MYAYLFTDQFMFSVAFFYLLARVVLLDNAERLFDRSFLVAVLAFVEIVSDIS